MFMKHIFITLIIFIVVSCGTEEKKDNTQAKELIEGISTSQSTNSPISETVINNLTGDDNLIVFNAYGNSENVIITGRAQEKEETNKVSEDDNFLTNFFNQLDFFSSDELSDVTIFASIDNKQYKTQTDDEGYFKFDIETDTPLLMGYKTIQLHIEDNLNNHATKIMVITEESDTPVIGIISDIDDTIIISDVTQKTELFLNTFWKNFTQRQIVQGMNKRFADILKNNQQKSISPLFFVSGSPTQLATPIESFLEYNQFPEHATILKQIQGDDSYGLFDQVEYKTEKIEALLELYPEVQWILFGDSGESDKDIYQSLQEDYTDQIEGFYIRNVETKEIKYFPTDRTSILDDLGGITDGISDLVDFVF